MSYKQIAGLIPTLQSIALVNENLKHIKKKKTKTGDMLNLGVKNLVGTSLIKVNADLVASL